MIERQKTVQDQVELWGAEARRLAETGREVSALDLYRKAAQAMPGAPWLQLRTAELARKLRQNEQATNYFLRAAAAFVAAGFPKRAVSPLRSAWCIARDGVPRSANTFVEVTYRLARLQSELGFKADSSVTIEYANDTLRRAGMRELSEAELTSGNAASRT